MDFYLNYYRLIGTILQQVIFTLTDPVTGISTSLTDFDETSLQSIYKIPIDGMNGSLQRCFKLNLTVSGVAISKFYTARLDYNVEPWRVLKKSISHFAVDDTGKKPVDDAGKTVQDDSGGIGVY